MHGIRYLFQMFGAVPVVTAPAEIDTATAGNRRITGWTWRGVPEPALARLQPRRQASEMARYRAYRAYLAGQAVEETFRRTVPFLTLTGANAASTPLISLDTRR